VWVSLFRTIAIDFNGFDRPLSSLSQLHFGDYSIVGYSSDIDQMKQRINEYLNQLFAFINTFEKSDWNRFKTPYGIRIDKMPPSIRDHFPKALLLVFSGPYGSGKSTCMDKMSKYLMSQMKEKGIEPRLLFAAREGDSASYYWATKKEWETFQTYVQQREARYANFSNMAMFLGATSALYVVGNLLYFGIKLMPSTQKMIVCQDFGMPTDQGLPYAAIAKFSMGPSAYVNNTLYGDKSMFVPAFNIAYVLDEFNKLLLLMEAFVAAYKGLSFLSNILQNSDHTPRLLTTGTPGMVLGDIPISDLCGKVNPLASAPQDAIKTGIIHQPLPIKFENLDCVLAESQKAISDVLSGDANLSGLCPSPKPSFPIFTFILATTNHYNLIIDDLKRQPNHHHFEFSNQISDPHGIEWENFKAFIDSQVASKKLRPLTTGALSLLEVVVKRETGSLYINRPLMMAMQAASSRHSSTLTHGNLYRELMRRGVEVDLSGNQPLLEACIKEDLEVSAPLAIGLPKFANDTIESVVRAYVKRYTAFIDLLQSKGQDGLFADDIDTNQLFGSVSSLLLVGQYSDSYISKVKNCIQERLSTHFERQGSDYTSSIVVVACRVGSAFRLKYLTAEAAAELIKSQDQDKKFSLAVHRLVLTSLASYTMFFLMTQTYKAILINDLVKLHDACSVPGLPDSDIAIIKSLKDADDFHALIFILKSALTFSLQWFATIAFGVMIKLCSNILAKKDDKSDKVFNNVQLIQDLFPYCTEEEMYGMVLKERSGLAPQENVLLGIIPANPGGVFITKGLPSTSKMLEMAGIITEGQIKFDDLKVAVLCLFVWSIQSLENVPEIIVESGRFVKVVADERPSSSPDGEGNAHTASSDLVFS